MVKLGHGSLLSVTRGSDEPAKLITLEYRGAIKNKNPSCWSAKALLLTLAASR